MKRECLEGFKSQLEAPVNVQMSPLPNNSPKFGKHLHLAAAPRADANFWVFCFLFLYYLSLSFELSGGTLHLKEKALHFHTDRLVMGAG